MAFGVLFNLGMLMLPVIGGAVAPQRPGDVTGTWNVAAKFLIVGGSADGQSRDMRAVLELVQKGTALTGRFIPYEADGTTPQPALSIVDGRVTAGKVTFRVQQDAQSALAFALVLTGGHLKGEATSSKDVNGGGKLKITVDASRRK